MVGKDKRAKKKGKRQRFPCPHHKTYRMSSFISTLINNLGTNGGKSPVSRPDLFTPKGKHTTHILGCFLCPRAVLEVLKERKISCPSWGSNIGIVQSIISHSADYATLSSVQKWQKRKKYKCCTNWIPLPRIILSNFFSRITLNYKTCRHNTLTTQIM
jgi:hypothetical protein